MIKDGGLGNSTQTGANWEAQTDLDSIIFNKHSMNKNKKDNEFIDSRGYRTGIFSVKQQKVFKFLRDKFNINPHELVSAEMRPDECIINTNTKKAFIIEKKTQSVDGSADEKIQACPFKKEQWQTIFDAIGYEVEFIFLFNDWFKQPKYRDKLAYALRHKCLYYFNLISDEKIQEMVNKILPIFSERFYRID